jgi:hypothetical protein
MVKYVNRYRARFWARFPRLSYWAGSIRVKVWLAMLYVAVLLANVADGRIAAHWMWLPAAVIAVLAVAALADAAVHAASCPCVTDPDWTPQPEDRIEGEN